MSVMSQPTGHAAFRQGRRVALADACWHRSAPLSPGKLRADDEIMCGYRGSCYDAKGRATFMPAQETINPSATVHSYRGVPGAEHGWRCAPSVASLVAESFPFAGAAL